jgi:hypothetical protein
VEALAGSCSTHKGIHHHIKQNQPAREGMEVLEFQPLHQVDK